MSDDETPHGTSTETDVPETDMPETDAPASDTSEPDAAESQPGASAGTIRVSAVVLRDGTGRVLQTRKASTRHLMFPGGKPEPGETPTQTAVRETREELGVELDEDRLAHVGSFRADAANEPGTHVLAEVFEHPGVPVGSPAAEIEEIRWQELGDRYPDDVAPLLADHVLPALAR